MNIHRGDDWPMRAELLIVYRAGPGERVRQYASFMAHAMMFNCQNQQQEPQQQQQQLRYIAIEYCLRPLFASC